MSKPVPAVTTQATVAEVYQAVSRAWQQELSEQPSRKALVCLLSQWALETGWGRSMICNNLGNIKHTDGDGQDWCVFQTQEYVGGRPAPTHAAFRAYASLDDGARDYVHLLHTRFGFAWPAIESGDVADFSHRLRARGYYTAPEMQYTNALLSIAGRIRTILDAASEATQPDIDPHGDTEPPNAA